MQSGKHPLGQNGEQFRVRREKIGQGGHPEGIGNGKTERQQQNPGDGHDRHVPTSRELVSESCLS